MKRKPIRSPKLRKPNLTLHNRTNNRREQRLFSIWVTNVCKQATASSTRRKEQTKNEKKSIYKLS